jgi:23S rRNA (guanosine2251-2'-O)-methyltransferase
MAPRPLNGGRSKPRKGAGSGGKAAGGGGPPRGDGRGGAQRAGRGGSRAGGAPRRDGSTPSGGPPRSGAAPQRGGDGPPRPRGPGGQGQQGGKAGGQAPDSKGRRPRPPAERRRHAAGVARAAKRDQHRADARVAMRPGHGQELLHGRRPVIEALRAGRPVERVFIAMGAGERGLLAELLGLARARGVPVQPVPRSAIDAEAGHTTHQGVLALAGQVETISLDRLLALPLETTEPPFLLALDGVTDPHNLGALARSADAAGCHGMVLPRHGSAPVSPTAIKSSAGALEHLMVAEVASLAKALQSLEDAGVWCVGLDEEGDTELFDLDLADQPVCIVVGAEGGGLGRLVREACDVLVSIPMSGRVASLNASVAGALALFEVRRRRAALTRPRRGKSIGGGAVAGAADGPTDGRRAHVSEMETQFGNEFESEQEELEGDEITDIDYLQEDYDPELDAADADPDAGEPGF